MSFSKIILAAVLTVTSVTFQARGDAVILNVTGYALKVMNLPVAQNALQSGVSYIQDGQIVKPDHLDLKRPYCYSTAFHFRLKYNELYRVLEVTNDQLEDGSWDMALKLETHSTDAEATFRLACYSKNKTTINEIQAGLAGVYQIVPVEN